MACHLYLQAEKLFAADDGAHTMIIILTQSKPNDSVKPEGCGTDRYLDATQGNSLLFSVLPQTSYTDTPVS